MIANLRRYARAFWLALRFTARGEQPPVLRVRSQHPQLATWWDESIRLANVVEQNAAERGIDLAKVTIRADRRDLSASTILNAVKFHAEHEYPYLFVQNEQYAALTVQATNLNDRYLIMLLAAADARLKPQAETLAEHLAAMPVI